MASRTITAAELETDLYRVLDDVNESGIEFCITVDGDEIAKLVPIKRVDSLQGAMEILVSEDEFLAPLDVTWDAAKD